jgi:phosphoribosylformylglycinamidine cyclo-ligase
MSAETSPDSPLTYEQSGVVYDLIDPLKVAAQRAAASTAPLLGAHGFGEVAASRGESAYVVDVGPFYLASIVECLGSKALVADEMQRLTGRSFYAGIAQDTIAMAVNDLITVGATPLVVQAYWAAGGSDWFGDAQRARALVDGWKRACEVCGVAWGGGETPALAGIVEAGRIDLAASCTGLVNPKTRLTLGDGLADGDAIVLLASSGIHANGLSLARKLAERLPQGYLTPIDGGQTYGEALLAPTTLYSPVTEALAKAGIVPHYAANITGHGWRKLLRHPGAFSYTHPHRAAGAAGAALHPAAGPAGRRRGLRHAEHGRGLRALRGGGRRRTHGTDRPCARRGRLGGRQRVEAGPKQLHIEPLGLRWEADALQLR